MAKQLMLQGTASGVGKSTLAAGLCRMFVQDGYRVAPFKAQNLSCNVHLLPSGLQMARSQALAAYACGQEPATEMNPILLKPCGETGTEVVLNGSRIGLLQEFDYPTLKQRLREEAMKAYKRLAAGFDIVVTEGAGSPVELNLKQDDLVNMGFAKTVRCPVLLVADISLGGVFASVYGTLALLEPEERELVQGIIVNKFYGEKKYFQQGKERLEEITGKPVLGVVPHIDLKIEDEDIAVDEQLKTRKEIESGLAPDISYREHLEKQFDQLAELLHQNLDVKKLYEIIDASAKIE